MAKKETEPVIPEAEDKRRKNPQMKEFAIYEVVPDKGLVFQESADTYLEAVELSKPYNKPGTYYILGVPKAPMQFTISEIPPQPKSIKTEWSK